MKLFAGGLVIAAAGALILAPQAAAQPGGWQSPASCYDIKVGDPSGVFWWQSAGRSLDDYCYGSSRPGFMGQDYWYESYGDETGWGSMTRGPGFCRVSWYPPVSDPNNPAAVSASIAAGTHENC
jgi:hypothetical protein